MAYDGWLEYNGVELVNLSRTAQLAQVIGIDTLWTSPSSVEWIEDALGGVGYDDITTAPWYVAGYPASAEFAGVVPLSMQGLDDSSLTSSPVEYVSDGGNLGKPRHTTVNIVASVALVASTDRGADYGKRWMDRVLRGTSGNTRCVGNDLTYFQYEGADSPKEYRHRVGVTRGSSVTRKRVTDCSSTWIVTFTLTVGDPFKYGEVQTMVTSLGGLDAEGPAVVSDGALALSQESCPVYDYTPLYDPLYPALVPAPSAPDFYPAGWGIVDGATFDRFWARLSPSQPTSLNVVPTIHLTTDVEARMIRVSIWPDTSEVDDQCDPLFSAVVSYLPPGDVFTIDGERKSSYIWDGFSPAVRRTDSLVYGPDAEPVQWKAFNDPSGLLVTLDVFSDSSGAEGDGTVRVALDLTPKSD